MNVRKVHRRAVLKLALTGSGLSLCVASFRIPNLVFAAPKEPNLGPSHADITLPDPDAIAIGAWVLISRAGIVTLLCNHAEMGQGVMTALAMLLAEELEVPMSRVQVRIAPPMTRYKNPRFNRQLTGESASVRGMYQGLREAGAQVRDQLLRAAAKTWNLNVESLKAQQGTVLAPDGRQSGYGALAVLASQLAPRTIALKQSSAWQLIGRKLARIDSGPKVNGTAIFGIDVKLPGMVYAAIKMGPVLGSTVISFDKQKIKPRKEIIDVISIGDGVAVVASSWWIAHKACQDLGIQWETGAKDKLSTEGLRHGLRKGLMQEITFAKGRVREKNFDSYPLPTMRHMPQVDTLVLASEASPGGIGEPGAALVQAATANAVSAALKRRVRSLPMTAANLRSLVSKT